MCNSIICSRSAEIEGGRNTAVYFFTCAATPPPASARPNTDGINAQLKETARTSIFLPLPRLRHLSLHARGRTRDYIKPYHHPQRSSKHMSGLSRPLVHNPIPFSLSAHSRLVISFNLADEKRQMFVLSSRGARLRACCLLSSPVILLRRIRKQHPTSTNKYADRGVRWTVFFLLKVRWLSLGGASQRALNTPRESKSRCVK